MEKLKIFTGNSNINLAKEIAAYIGIELSEAFVTKFSDGEIFVKILENVRGQDVFVIQPTQPPADNLMELLIMIDALKRASARRITAVIPYFGYARQDKKDEPRVPISAKLVADLISVAGANRVLSMDLHAEQIQGYFNIPVDHLYAAPVMIEYIKNMNLNEEKLVIVSPDLGRANRARAIAKRINNVPIAIIDKRRPKPNEAEVINVVGDVNGKNTIIVDDIVDTAGTIVAAAEALQKNGASKISAFITHPVLSGSSLKRIKDSPIEKMVVTNSIPLKSNNVEKIESVSVAPLLGEAIIRINEERSVSSLFV
ncbi:ribose-phosphate pyrophosphokinase [candidate division WOR-3 bacterium]|nr:ribose-phosphate pyrophosphokinase [candidate division WOR-3 bacterium]